jgi:hypothetical protein
LLTLPRNEALEFAPENNGKNNAKNKGKNIAKSGASE